MIIGSYGKFAYLTFFSFIFFFRPVNSLFDFIYSEFTVFLIFQYFRRSSSKKNCGIKFIQSFLKVSFTIKSFSGFKMFKSFLSFKFCFFLFFLNFPFFSVYFFFNLLDVKYRPGIFFLLFQYTKIRFKGRFKISFFFEFTG
ncbi:MAG: hypothetical protein ACD_79C00872G0003 [uncultured bacterium]|nr:MAG: hypothetical protein ACD_79C00872G0003 [uncultured bacterium]